jgi:hypothetical protein
LEEGNHHRAAFHTLDEFRGVTVHRPFPLHAADARHIEPPEAPRLIMDPRPPYIEPPEMPDYLRAQLEAVHGGRDGTQVPVQPRRNGGLVEWHPDG